VYVVSLDRKLSARKHGEVIELGLGWRGRTKGRGLRHTSAQKYSLVTQPVRRVVLSTPKARMVHQVNVPQYFVREVCVRRESIDVVTKGTQGTQQGRASSEDSCILNFIRKKKTFITHNKKVRRANTQAIVVESATLASSPQWCHSTTINARVPPLLLLLAPRAPPRPCLRGASNTISFARPVGSLPPTPSSNNERGRSHQLPTFRSRIVGQEEGSSSLSPPTIAPAAPAAAA
jgi:hypothetical protein